MQLKAGHLFVLAIMMTLLARCASGGANLRHRKRLWRKAIVILSGPVMKWTHIFPSCLAIRTCSILIGPDYHRVETLGILLAQCAGAQVSKRL